MDRDRLRKKVKEWFPVSHRDTAVTAVILLVALGVCFLLRAVDERGNVASMVLIVAVLLIGRMTTGYLYGILASVLGVVGINYVFTYPYLAFNFTIDGYPLTFLTMLVVSVFTSAMTNQLRGQERLRAENENEKMRANLLRAVSHDIRTPLTSIIGATTTLLENGEDLSAEERRDLLLDARSDAQWLIRVVENMLSVTRIGSEKAQIKKSEEAAEEIIGSVAQVFRKRFPDIPISVEAPEEFLLVPMDAILIQQVLVNLLENAVIHGETTSSVRLTVAREANTARFAVRDNGKGIAEEKLPTLFRKSFRPSGDDNREGKRNMGLGLMVCTAIVQAHGGTIGAQNLPEGGAEIAFCLPLSKEEEHDYS